MTCSERIKFLVDAVGGRTALAKRLGVRYQSVNSWYNSKSVSMACARSIHAVLPWVNMNWLIFGEGDMDFYGSEHKKLLEAFKSANSETERLNALLKSRIAELESYNIKTV